MDDFNILENKDVKRSLYRKIIMSHAYFLQAHLNREPQNIPTINILEIFRDYIVEKGETYIDLEFDEGNSCTIYLDTDEPNNSGFMVSRPCSGRLWECLYEVMLLGNFVFFEPGGLSMIIVNPEVERHLPTNMIESLGKPVVVQNRESFLKLK